MWGAGFAAPGDTSVKRPACASTRLTVKTLATSMGAAPPDSGARCYVVSSGEQAFDRVETHVQCAGTVRHLERPASRFWDVKSRRRRQHRLRVVLPAVAVLGLVVGCGLTTASDVLASSASAAA